MQTKSSVQFEKDKEEMLKNLKDVGEKCLGWFGMSMDQFNMQQDPKTGGYSVNFQQGE